MGQEFFRRRKATSYIHGASQVSIRFPTVKEAAGANPEVDAEAVTTILISGVKQAGTLWIGLLHSQLYQVDLNVIS